MTEKQGLLIRITLDSDIQIRIQCLVWGEDFDPEALPDGGAEATTYVVAHPSWHDIWDALARLDGAIYPDMFLYMQDQPYTQPFMSIAGGPTDYAVSLALPEDPATHQPEKMLHYIDPRRAAEVNSCGVREVGRATTNLEIEEVLFTSDREVVMRLARYFEQTGAWHPAVPYVEFISGAYEYGRVYVPQP